jgi:hypothetical protein
MKIEFASTFRISCFTPHELNSLRGFIFPVD